MFNFLSKAQNSDKKPRIGVCLSGGGALGFAHIGALQALEEHGIVIDEISGASMGSIVGSLYAAGYKPAQMLDIIHSEKMYKTTKVLNVWSIPSFGKSGFFNHNVLRKVLREHVPDNSFECLKIPFYLSVTNLLTGDYEIISSGDSLDAWVAASASIPGVFENISLNNNLYCDGGVLNNLPAQPLAKTCDLIIGINVVPYLPHNNDFKQISNALELTIRIAQNKNSQPGKEICHHLIDVEAIKKYNEFSFEQYNEIYLYGYNAVEEYIKLHPELDLAKK
ncbi:hypothetical protein FACS189434_09000 [Bacteroidia bacterium]|nr:hypothetical protein FACS189434_09000 [Bacteroidia bacterium]